MTESTKQLESVVYLIDKLKNPMERSNQIRKHKLSFSILKHTEFLDTRYNNISLQQRIWHIINNNFEIQICKYCGGDAIYHRTKYTTCNEKKCFLKFLHEKSNTASASKQRRNTFIDTCIKKYGVDHPEKSSSININDILYWKDKLPKNYFINEKIEDFYNITHMACGNSFNIYRKLLTKRIIAKHELCTICNPLSKPWSAVEKELFIFIKTLSDDCMENDKKTISDYELDVYSPSHKIAVEFNGLYWHSDIFRNRTYHYDKYKACLNNNIRLINVWEDDWYYKQDIIKSIIENAFGKINCKIFARKCIIKKLNITEYQEFLDTNHILGKTAYQHSSYGLFFNNELVSVIGFVRQNKNFILSRFCSKIGTTIIGGATKLMSAFIKEYNPLMITTYSNNDIFDGKLYEKLNFKYDGNVEISYWYTNFDLTKSCRIHKTNFRKNKIKERYKIDIEGKTEKELTESLGYHRIYDCGLKRFIWTRPS